MFCVHGEAGSGKIEKRVGVALSGVALDAVAATG